MRRRTSIGLIGAALARPFLARAAAPLRVGFVYIGPVGDFGWSYQHDVARRAAEQRLGDAIKTTFVENVAEGPDAENVLRQLAADHALIFATSFGYMNYVQKVAKQFPGVRFEHATGYKRAANVATYNIRFYEARYVQGFIAGHLSKTGRAGYVGSVPVPEVVQGLNAFMLGMRSVNPAARLKFIMVDSWYDPPKEGDAARALMDQGCDVITQHTDSPAPLQAAAARKTPGFGQSTDMARFAPDTTLSSSVDNWTPYYIARIQAALDGTWSSTDTWSGFAGGMLRMTPFHAMPDGLALEANALIANISAGRTSVFAGPIADQSGMPKVPAGTTLDDAALAAMRWLADGIDGALG